MGVMESSNASKGKIAEDLAADFLEKNGCKIIQRNYRFGRAEIDLIFQEEDFLIFGEVKYRTNLDYGHSESFLSDDQENRIMDAADQYLNENPWRGRVRFDIISIEGKLTSPVVRVFRDAF